MRMRPAGQAAAPGGQAAAPTGGQAAPSGGQPGLTRPLIVLLATACGAAVANNYYAQPLLHTIGTSFGVPGSTAGLLVTAGQLGYAAGLAFLVPLGDVLERRRLITRMLVITSAALAAAAAAPSIAVLASALVIVGVTTVVAQIIVPMTASLAAGDQRGRAVGTVMSGLMIGVLMARVVSGVVAATLGWRTVYVIAAVAMLVLAAVLRRMLPTVEPSGSISYRALLKSVLALVREEPVLRQRMALGAMAMGSFSILWTAVAFLLSGPPYRYGNAVIGLFGLAGLAGAVAAPQVGRLADRGYRRYSTLGALGHLAGQLGPARAGRPLAGRADTRCRPARSGRPVAAHQQPERHLRAAPGGAQPAQHRLHARLLHRRRGHVGRHLAGVQRGRLDRCLPTGRAHRRSRPGHLAVHPAPQHRSIT